MAYTGQNNPKAQNSGTIDLWAFAYSLAAWPFHMGNMPVDRKNTQATAMKNAALIY